jgi:hypothetical protein
VIPSASALSLLVAASADTSLEVELHRPLKPQNYLPQALIDSTTVAVPAGEKRWVDVPLEWPRSGNAIVVLRANPDLCVHTASSALPAMIYFAHRDPAPDELWTEQFRSWKHILPRAGLCLRLGETTAYAASNVIGGYSRPYGGPQLWSSEDLAWDPEPWIQLSWPTPVELSEIVVVLDDDVDEDLINLHHHRAPFEVLRTLLNTYVLEARDGDGPWRTVVSVRDNHHRTNRHHLPAPVTTTALRLRARTTNGAPRAHVVNLRAYHR